MSQKELWKQKYRQQRISKQAAEDMENEDVTMQEIESLIQKGKDRLQQIIAGLK